MESGGVQEAVTEQVEIHRNHWDCGSEKHLQAHKTAQDPVAIRPEESRAMRTEYMPWISDR